MSALHDPREWLNEPGRLWKSRPSRAVHMVPNLKSQVTHGQSVQSQLSRAWKVGTYHFTRVPSPSSRWWHGCLHGNTFWRWGSGLVFGVGWSKKLDTTLNTSPANCFPLNNQGPHLMIINHILMVSWGSTIGTLPFVLGLANMSGTWDPMWTGPQRVRY
jgi:hypothetical protein